MILKSKNVGITSLIVRTTRHLMFATLTMLFFAPAAHAIVAVTVSNASVVETTDAGAITVYGGTAGDKDRCIGGTTNTSTCNNCALKAGESGAGGDALLLPCNEHRIYETLQFVIAVTSDAIDGQPTITNAAGDRPLAFSGPGSLAKGSTGTITLNWSAICTEIFSADINSGGQLSGCDSVNGYASGSLKVGISAASNGLLNASGDDVKTINFVIRNVAGNTAGNVPSLADKCADTIDTQICYFELGPGDEKAIVRTLRAPEGSGFPSAATTQFRYVRFLFETGDFANINLASAHQDLTAIGSGVDTFDVDPRRITGLTNDTTYYFKNALVDAAGNVGLYSQSLNDGDCSSAPDPNSNDCRIVTPSEVVGVLDKTNCFIATAAYGGSFAKELVTLRDFRDQILSRSRVGLAFTRWYYDHSPRYAKMILDHPAARATVRAALVPVVWFAGFTLAYGPMRAGLAFLASLILIAALLAFARRHAVRGTGSGEAVKVRKETRRSLLPMIFAALLLPALGASGLFQSANAESTPTTKVVRRKPAQTVTPLEELRADTDEDTPPEPEYPYPGAQGTTAPQATSGSKKKRLKSPNESSYPADTLEEPSDEVGSNSTEPFTEPSESVDPEPPYPPRTPTPRARRKAPMAGSEQRTARRPHYTGTSPVDPNNSPYQKPQMVNDEGEYIYEKVPDKQPRQYAPPKRHKFSKLPGREAPASITLDGEFNYPVKESEFSGAAGIRFGFMSAPNITNASNGLNFKDIYGSDEVPALLFEYEYPLTRAIGRIGLKFETGAYAKQAAGRFKNPSRLAELPEERFTFVMIPLQAVVHYRFQFADSQLFVPFFEGGAAYNGIVELRDDNKAPLFGGAPALVAGGGVNILLDWIDKRSIRQLDAEYGINHVWLTAQYRQTIGLKSDLDISSHLISAGFTFDY
jgi:hypothetical protein